jgi:nucleoid DNA-binding protein
VSLPRPQLLAAVADRAELSKADTKRLLDALEEVVQDELGNAQKVRIGGLVQLTVRVKPAQKKPQGRNPGPGEEATIAAKPASVDVRARSLARAKKRCRPCRRRAADLPPDLRAAQAQSIGAADDCPPPRLGCAEVPRRPAEEQAREQD